MTATATRTQIQLAEELEAALNTRPWALDETSPLMTGRAVAARYVTKTTRLEVGADIDTEGFWWIAWKNGRPVAVGHQFTAAEAVRCVEAV